MPIGIKGSTFIRNLLIVFFFITLSFLFSQEILLKVGYENKEQPPYYLGNSEIIPESPGLAVSVVKELENRIPGLKVELSRFPWIRCLSNLENNLLDGVFNASYKKERLLIGEYPWKGGFIDRDRRIATISYSFYRVKGSSVTWDGEVFKNLDSNIGAPRGYSVVEDIKRLNLPVEEADSSYLNLRKLIAGRVNVVALQTVTGDALIKDHTEEFSKIIKIEPPFKTKDYYLMLSKEFVKEHPELSEKIWDEIGKLRIEYME